MAAKVNKLSSSRMRLARIRCAKEVIACFQAAKSFPEPFCYIPSKCLFRINRKYTITALSSPSAAEREKICEIECDTCSIIVVGGERVYNKTGEWAKLLEVYDQFY